MENSLLWPFHLEITVHKRREVFCSLIRREVIPDFSTSEGHREKK